MCGIFATYFLVSEGCDTTIDIQVAALLSPKVEERWIVSAKLHEVRIPNAVVKEYAEILGDVLGLGDAEIARLRAAGVV